MVIAINAELLALVAAAQKVNDKIPDTSLYTPKCVVALKDAVKEWERSCGKK